MKPHVKARVEGSMEVKKATLPEATRGSYCQPKGFKSFHPNEWNSNHYALA